MTRVTRSRSRILRGTHSGSVVRTYPPNPAAFPTETYTYMSGDLSKEYCDDSFGTPWIDTQFAVAKGVCPRVSISGVRYLFGLVYTSTDVPLQSGVCLLMREPYNYTYFIRDPLNDSALTQMALANMNPNRPVADLGVDLLELREIPELLRDATELLSHLPGSRTHSAKANIVAQFGILPIIRDVVALFDFVNVVDRREKYLRELSSGFKRIKRKLTEEAWDAISPAQVPFPPLSDDQSATNAAYVSCHATRSYWFTARAKLVCPLTEREIHSLSARIAYGVDTITAKQLWELIPWSWLIDWFSTTGDLMAAYRGGLKWQWEALNLMYSTTYDMSIIYPFPRSGFNYTPSHPQGKCTVKIRRNPVYNAIPQWRIPYLNFSQVSILLSLATIRINWRKVQYLLP